MAAIPPQAVRLPIAAPRSRGANAATMMASELGTISAAAAPCNARPPMSTPIVGASAQAIDTHTKSRDPDCEHAPLAIDVAEGSAVRMSEARPKR